MQSAKIAVQSAPSAQPMTDIASEEPWIRRWTRDEYERMAEAGILTTEERVQLIEGEIFQMSPPGSLHATSVLLTDRALNSIANEQQHVRSQQPVLIGDDSEPQPDVAIHEGLIRDYEHEHPTAALLAVEVSDSTLRFDRTRKARIYARAGIQEYWIINLRERCVEVWRNPVTGSKPEGPRYATLTTYKPGESIEPLATPGRLVAVDDLLPRPSD